MKLSHTIKLKRSDNIIAKTVGTQIFLFNNTSGNLYSMNETAGEIWKKLATPTSMHDLITHQLNTFDATPSTIKRDTVKLIEQLVTLGFVKAHEHARV